MNGCSENSPSKKILLIGAYGAGNLGDEAILQGMLMILEERGIPKEDIAIWSWSPLETSSLFGVKAIQRDDSKDLPEEYDKLVLGGGGVLYAANFPIIFRRLFQYLMLRKEVEVYGVGTDELFGSAPFAKDLLNKVDSLSVRTLYDKQYLESIGVTREIKIVDCPSLLIPTPTKEQVLEILGKYFDISKPLLGVCIKPWRIKQSPTPSFLDFLSERFQPRYTFIPLVMCRHKFSPDEMDEVSLKALFEELGLFDEELNEWFSLKMTPSLVKGIVQSMDFVITNRKHPLMFAAQKKIPTMILEDTPTFILSKYARCYGVNFAWVW